MKKAMIVARTISRNIGLTKLIQKLLPKRDYEQVFADAMMSAIQPDDTVWDVGANVGFYSRKFLQAVGPGGTVIAFEPAPACVEHLQEIKSSNSALQVVHAALGNRNGVVQLSVAADKTSPANRVLDYGMGSSGSTIDVSMYRAEDAQRQFTLLSPSIIKIDVEGYEMECIEGLGCILECTELRTLFVEVHFGILADRGLPFVPVQIENHLRKSGFRVAWIDASHLKASRV